MLRYLQLSVFSNLNIYMTRFKFRRFKIHRENIILRFYATFVIGMLPAHDGLCNNLAHNAISETDADIIFMRHALNPGFENPKKISFGLFNIT